MQNQHELGLKVKQLFQLKVSELPKAKNKKKGKQTIRSGTRKRAVLEVRGERR